ncbi:hypothetical protein ACLOAV_000284 [Pseudogymnoascus australis]
MILSTPQWYRALQGYWDQATAADDPPIPTLPKSRPRILTPSTSRESLFESAASATANSAFFLKLPFEIRHKILRDAFGDRTIHMDLYFDYPMKPLSERQPNRTQGVGGARVPPPEPQWGIAREQRKQWQWLSGECYRGSHVMASKMVDYAEGIDVLYATNTIHMTGNALLQRLQEAQQEVQYEPGVHMAADVLPRQQPNVLLSKRLGSITSVRIRWTYHPFEEPYEPSFYGETGFKNFLMDLPRMFPHLKKLYLTLDGMKPRSPVEHGRLIEVIESDILVPVDGMVRQLGPQIQKCYVGISAFLYAAMKHDRTNPNQQRSTQERYDWSRTWRELPASDSTSLQQAAHLNGYSIRIGQLDLDLASIIPQGYDDF